MPRTAFPSDPAVAMFAGAAGRAAVFELKARMFADAVGDLPGSITKSLEPLIKDIVAWMQRSAKGTPEEHEKLLRCARIRNKLFHAEFSRVTGQLVRLDAELKAEGVSMFSWAGSITPDKLLGAIEAGGAPVGETKTREGMVFAWLLESSASGAFGEAAAMFDEAAEIIERALPGYRE